MPTTNALTFSSPPVNSAEAGARIKILTGIERSPTQVRAFMKRHGLKFVKLGHIPRKADTEKQQEWVEKTLKRIDIICDNARYQHCNLVIEAAKLLNINILFLPSYSPNLNIIERLWKFTKKEILYAKYYETPDKFHNAINNFMQNINQNHIHKLNNLLTLNFQFFKNVKIYPV